jgi:hypothetical protein
MKKEGLRKPRKKGNNNILGAKIKMVTKSKKK